MRAYATACMVVVFLAALPASGQQAPPDVQVVPSPDGRFQQCISRDKFAAVAVRLNHFLAGRWVESEKSSKRRVVLTVETIKKAPNERKWIQWIGWSSSPERAAETPEMFCVWRGSQGFIFHPENSSYPKSPFGLVQKNDGFMVDPSTPFKRGTLYSECKAVARVSGINDCEKLSVSGYMPVMTRAGFNPCFSLRSSSGEIFIVFRDKTGRAKIAVVLKNGITSTAMDGDRFVVSPAMIESASSFGL